MPKAHYVLIPGTPETKGAPSHSGATLWKNDLAKLMAG